MWEQNGLNNEGSKPTPLLGDEAGMWTNHELGRSKVKHEQDRTVNLLEGPSYSWNHHRFHQAELGKVLGTETQLAAMAGCLEGVPGAKHYAIHVTFMSSHGISGWV